MVALPDPTSATNIIPFGPATDSPGFALPVAGCRCLICQAFTSPEAIDQLEIDIMDIVADLLDHGWVPEALVERVEELALRGPYACQIVTLAIVSHAGYWLSSPAMFDLLDDVDELAAGFSTCCRDDHSWLAAAIRRGRGRPCHSAQRHRRRVRDPACPAVSISNADLSAPGWQRLGNLASSPVSATVARRPANSVTAPCHDGTYEFCQHRDRGGSGRGGARCRAVAAGQLDRGGIGGGSGS